MRKGEGRGGEGRGGEGANSSFPRMKKDFFLP